MYVWICEDSSTGDNGRSGSGYASGTSWEGWGQDEPLHEYEASEETDEKYANSDMSGWGSYTGSEVDEQENTWVSTDTHTERDDDTRTPETYDAWRIALMVYGVD